VSNRGLQTLLITALTDQRRKEALLQGCPTAYEGFDLSAGEIGDLLEIQAETLIEFAQQAHWLLYGEDLSREDDSAAQPVGLLRVRNCA
jgi:hypothetical protein